VGEPTFAGAADDVLKPLPGTRREVEAIARLFPQADTLLGKAASERGLEALARDGRLRGYAVLHFATHGLLDPQRPMQSALALARDDLPDPLERVLAGQPAYTGRLTAGQVMAQWQLDAELVTLSACQTGLGKYSGGEGYLGFSQAFFLAGARSLLLSLWPVDDTATALLMTRFYENLLGKRDGLKALSKVEALREAQAWLRRLTAEQVDQQVARLPKAERGDVRTRPQAIPPEAHPYARPYYWSAFILIGDPD
jgi:CHAT domain-containing protein